MTTQRPCAYPAAEHRNQFTIGGISVLLDGDDPAAVELVPALMPFQAGVGLFDIRVRVERFSDLDISTVPALFDSGSVWRLYDDDSGFRFDFSVPTFGHRPYKRLIVDRDFSQAMLQISGPVFDTYTTVAPLDYPLDELLITHRLTQEKAIELHGSGIVRADGIGNLFVGHSGAGKSTTTRLWTERENVEVLSDDRIIVRRDDQPFRAPSAALGISARGSDAAQAPQLRLRDRSASPIGHSAQDDRAEKQIPRSSRNGKGQMRMYGTPWHGEAMYASPNSAPLARIFVLEHGHGNVITPLTPSQAVAELFARSFVPFHRHEYVDSALVFLEELANAVPVYRYAFEPDQRAVEKIRNFHD
jgi:hypothetical protein